MSSERPRKQAIDMRMFARNAGSNMTFQPGATLFNEGDVLKNVYVVQSGTVDILTHDKVADTCGPGDVLGFISIIDGGASTGTARVKETAELSILDERKFFFMVDEVPNFALYIMRALAHRIRGLREMV
jgi:CRP/FNR family transcriptional regulator, cyclic AMP receptor protein